MTLTNKDIDVYFHMKNHYLKLRNAKSTFIFSPKKAQVKSGCSLPEKYQKMKEFEDKHFKNKHCLPYYNNDSAANIPSFYHSEFKGESNILSDNRPSTRRNAAELPPPPKIVKPRTVPYEKYTHPKSAKARTTEKKKKSSPSPKKSNSPNRNMPAPGNSRNDSLSSRSGGKDRRSTPTGNSKRSLSLSSQSGHEIDGDAKVTSPITPTKRSSRETRRNEKIEEHEYLVFLLRVTEDIIMNNYYLNEDIERVFKEHMENNKNRLDKEKMEQHLATLADELHIYDVQTNFPAAENSCNVQKSFYNPNVQNFMDLECDNNQPNVNLDLYLNPPVDPNYYYNQTYQNNLDEIIYYRHSLGRLTEHTEPTNSSTTIGNAVSTCPTKSNNNLSETMLMDLSESKLKIFDTRSAVFIRKNSEGSICPSKQLRIAISENIMHQNDLNEESETDFNNEIKPDQNENVVEFKSEQKKTVDASENVVIDEAPVVICKDSLQKIDDEIEEIQEHSNADRFRTERGSNVAELTDKESNQFLKSEKSDFSTDSTEKYELAEKYRTSRFKTSLPEHKKCIASELIVNDSSTTVYSDFTTEKSEINDEKRTNCNTEETHEKIGDFDTSKRPVIDNKVAEKGDFETDNKEDKSIKSGFHLHQKYDMRLNLDFARDSIESMVPSPYLETAKEFPNVEESKSYSIFPIDRRPVEEADKSVQTSHRIETDSKCVQMSCAYTTISCCTEENDFHVDVNDYVLITSPVYVLKSVLRSPGKIVIEKDEFLDRLDEGHSEANSLDTKLLGTDYDLTPERDTTVVPSGARVPSLASIQEDNLLLTGVYDLHEIEADKELDTDGSGTYRCLDVSKSMSCDDEIFHRKSEVLVTRNSLSDREVRTSSQARRFHKLKQIQMLVSNSTSSASLNS
ncbi:unnamed protein product [Phyllotreta striolata]|uniref:Uncharacterized protein n=1 Tax=Phyllotreta striolata TaxID=444603 RepID=A0A9N9TSB0_PHYSR|nr:unnamed protein product [Phyllotreta striolata]